MPVAVFFIGGSANGKSAVVRHRYVGTVGIVEPDDPRYQEPREGFSVDRWFDPDDYRKRLPTYTDAVDDSESRDRFDGVSGLGGADGPKNMAELERYPEYVQEEILELVEDLGYTSLEEFARDLIMDPADTGSIHFGKGLTHELCTFIAQVAFERELSKGPTAGSIIWDATGNTIRYKRWIALALQLGFDVEIVFVRCPLPVALMRAHDRARQVPPEAVRGTYSKAARAADDLRLEIGSNPAWARVSIETVNTSFDGELDEAIELGYGELPK